MCGLLNFFALRGDSINNINKSIGKRLDGQAGLFANNGVGTQIKGKNGRGLFCKAVGHVWQIKKRSIEGRVKSFIMIQLLLPLYF